MALEQDIEDAAATSAAVDAQLPFRPSKNLEIDMSESVDVVDGHDKSVTGRCPSELDRAELLAPEGTRSVNGRLEIQKDWQNSPPRHPNAYPHQWLLGEVIEEVVHSSAASSSVTLAGTDPGQPYFSNLEALASTHTSGDSTPQVEGSVSADSASKRQRIPRACDTCRRKKTRCNMSLAELDDSGQSKVCVSCRQAGIECIFTKTAGKRGPSKTYIRQLETRLAPLESTASQGGLPSERSRVQSKQSRGRDPYKLPPQKRPRLADSSKDVSESRIHVQHSSSMPSTLRCASQSGTPAPSDVQSKNCLFPSDLVSSHTSGSAIEARHDSSQQLPSSLSQFGVPQNSRSPLPPISHLLASLPPVAAPPTWSSRHSTYTDGIKSLFSTAYDDRVHGPFEADSLTSGQHVDALPTQPPSVSSADTFTSRRGGGGSHPIGSTVPSMHQNIHSQKFEMSNGVIGSYAAGYHNTYGLGLPSRSSEDLTHPHPQLSTSHAPLDRESGNARMLDILQFRKALFKTPAMRTFGILPKSCIEMGLGSSKLLLQAAYMSCTSSTRHPTLRGQAQDERWQQDLSIVIGQCFSPMTFDGAGSDATLRETEALMLCYIDAFRRGRLVSGILGAISGKLAVLDTRAVPCKRYRAVGILLAVWHTVGYSSRGTYIGSPAISGPEALYEALESDDPVLRAICVFTFNMDAMCRRYCQNAEIYVDPRSIDLTAVVAARSTLEPLPDAHLRMLSMLDAFLLALNFVYYQTITSLPDADLLEQQRHSLYAIVIDTAASGVLSLIVGPHILAMGACASFYCLAACREHRLDSKASSEVNTNMQTLEHDYFSILEDWAAWQRDYLSLQTPVTPTPT